MTTEKTRAAAMSAGEKVHTCTSAATVDQATRAPIPPCEACHSQIATLEASLAPISDAMIRGSKRWRDAHPNSNIVIPDLANLVEWLLEQIQIRDGKIATLEAEVRRLTAERDEAVLGRTAAQDSCNALEISLIAARAQLATLSRCGRNLCDDFEKYSLAVAKLLVDPNRQVFASEHAEHVALAAKVTESWKQARTSLAALDSGGGEGEKASAGALFTPEMVEALALADRVLSRLETATDIIESEHVADDDIEDEREFIGESRTQLDALRKLACGGGKDGE